MTADNLNLGLQTVRAPVMTGVVRVAFFLIIMLSLLSPLMVLSDLPGFGEQSPVRQVAYIGLFLALIVALRPDSAPSRLNTVPWPILVALGWCWLSLAWSTDRGASVSHLILTTIVLWSVFTCVAELKFSEINLFVRIALVVLVAANFATVLVNPAFGIHQVNDVLENNLAGDWRGMMMHKNIAGLVMAITIIYFIFYAKEIAMAIRLPVIAAAAIFLALSTSKTSTGMLVAAILVGLIFRYYSWRLRPLMVIAVLVIAIGTTVISFIYKDPLKAQWSNPEAFTGRTRIWAAVLGYAEDNGIVGSGFGAFWNIGGSSPVYKYATGWVTEVGTAHNGYLDILAQTGIIGLVLVVGTLIFWPLGVLLWGSKNSKERSALLSAVMIFCIGHNFTESSIFDRDQIANVFLMLAAALALKGETRRTSGFNFRLSLKKA